MEFGVQTFTIRKTQKKSIRSAYLPLIKLGIKHFEVARIDFNAKNAKELRALVDEYDIDICSIQVKPKYVFGDIDNVVKFCDTVGCKNIVISMLPFRCILGGEDKFYDFVSTLDATCDEYAKRGITLAYHHHNWEYIKLTSGRTRMAELIDGTKKLKFVHDTYWTARCGIAPAKQIAEFGERLLGIHLRDLTFKSSGIDVISSDGALGDGVVDFASVLSTAELVGCQYYVIEQKTDKPYREIEKSYSYIEKIKNGLNKE